MAMMSTLSVSSEKNEASSNGDSSEAAPSDTSAEGVAGQKLNVTTERSDDDDSADVDDSTQSLVNVLFPNDYTKPSTTSSMEEQNSRDSSVSTTKLKSPRPSDHSRSNSRGDSSSSYVASQQQQETLSHYTDSNNSMFMSESEEDCYSNNRIMGNKPLLENKLSMGSEMSPDVLSHHHDMDDDDLVDPSAALNFAMEHRIFLRAALNLLTERDRHAPELGMMDPIILKAGALKKASHLMNGVWKVKYAEIRRGMFSYYENAVSGASDQGELLLRKNIPLEATHCTCRAVKLHQKALNFSPGGAIFEVSSHGENSTSKRLWMATSREDRQAWMQAINNAMVGGSVTRGDSLMDHRGIVRTVSARSPFRADLRKYLKTQSVLRGAKTVTEYMLGLRELVDQSLHVPVKWIAKQGMLNDTSTGHNRTASTAFDEETVALSVDQLWRDLQRDSVSINGEIFRGDASHGPEHIIGGLARSILNVARRGDSSRSDLRESKALVYARDLLLAGNRTRSGGDSYYSVNTLCSNSDLVVVVPSGREVEPVTIEVSEDDSDASFQNRFNDKSGWVKTRNKVQKTWRKHFFVLSEGTLTYYEGVTPRPHGLRGQRVLTDAILSTRKIPKEESTTGCDEFILNISLKDGATKDRLLMFDSEVKLLDWMYALECVVKAKSSTDPKNRRRGNNVDPGDSNLASSMVDVLKIAEHATLEHASKLGLSAEEATLLLASYTQKATSAVRVAVRASTEYKVCTTDPQGTEDDTWATIQGHFLQAFRITGGPNGQIVRGEEIVRLSIVDCLEPAVPPPPTQEANMALSPSSMRARINRRIFRNPSGSEENEGTIFAR